MIYLYHNFWSDDLLVKRSNSHHGRMARVGNELPNVSPGHAMPYPSTPCGRATPETALQLFQGWLAHRAGNLRPPSTPSDTSRRTPKTLMASFRSISTRSDQETGKKNMIYDRADAATLGRGGGSCGSVVGSCGLRVVRAAALSR
jgi:hypothetical protein